VVLVTDREFDEAACRRVLHRVLDEVERRTLQRHGIAQHQYRLVDLDADGDAA